MIFPTVLGVGREGLRPTSDKSTWELKEAKPVGSDGVLTLEYEKV